MTNERAITLDRSNEKALADLKIIENESRSDITEVVNDHQEVSKKEIGLPPLDHEEEHDGGYGWFVILGAFFVQVTSFGTITSWGVMQDYYEQHLFNNTPNAALNLSFVGTIAMVCMNSASPIVQICVSVFGIRAVLITGTLFIGIGLEMAGFATQIWHLYLTQGVVFGIGASCIYVAIMGVAPQWFTKRRGLALGLVASGSGIGGLIIPFVMTPVNQRLGPGWTYRILGFVCLFCDILACITVRQRIPSTKARKRLSQIIDFSVFKNANFVLFTIASNIGLFGYFIPYFFLPSYATYIGLSDTEGSALVAVSAAGNFIGRIICGFLADRFGKVNTNLLFTFISSLSCLLIWTFSSSYGSLMAFSVVFGLTSGSFFALISPLTAYILGPELFPSGLSLLLLSNVIPVFGSNIASAVESGVDASPFFSYKMFAGVAYLVGAFVLLILKLKLNRNPFAKV
ncbi:major facilitator superfamily domain-containing protein [Gilbertella persicaria]|uniref:major facilitator superfamily domain-containing protein n=1 Tax=Gilbertella persicaria TaxID=101096 RepID=UPI00221F54C1|nr:major facilitator superfamily domain-containing protein [Gilbertella persicaria]KAI8072262.1 major facilitator superfamily domain-containing protein [Gilbertella persicaria]